MTLLRILILFCFHLVVQGKETESLPEKKLKVLHLTLHKGCAKEMESVASELSLELTTWNIHDLPSCMLDGVTKGNAIYNIGHERAEKIWNLHKDFFLSFDVIMTSDTAPLSRIFLQNGWKKPLVIWICNRFDYYDGASLDCDFPDTEYYQLFGDACRQDNVKVVAYTAYEHYYAKLKGINTGNLVIKPTGKFPNESYSSAIPPTVVKSETFFLPPYHNETIFMNAVEYFAKLKINGYCGRYSGVKDIEEFKAVIHLPYAWSNLALFENIYSGIPYLVPSAQFIKELMSKKNYFYQDSYSIANALHLSEWYASENAPCFIYFDSWEDLKIKVNSVDFSAQRENIKKIGAEHAQEMLRRWKKVFELK